MGGVVRQVWRENLKEEFVLIQQVSEEFRLVAVDTEYPGTVFKPEEPYWSLSHDQHYSSMKENVDALNIIQLGLTLSDTKSHCAWQFNFSDFDPRHHLHDCNSIALLANQGIDFSENKRHGIDSREFAFLFSEILMNSRSVGKAWFTFHGLYDLGYLIKILTGMPLPEHLDDFMRLVRFYMGSHMYDLKVIMEMFGEQGSLEKVAKTIGSQRSAGKRHQAGSDSLLTMDAFVRLFMPMSIHHPPSASRALSQFNYKLYGLTWLPKLLPEYMYVVEIL